jgi:hypothetical protein
MWKDGVNVMSVIWRGGKRKEKKLGLFLVIAWKIWYYRNLGKYDGK